MAISPVASYFAQVGVTFDRRTFDAVERRIESLKQKLTRLGTATGNKRLMLRAELDKTSLASMRAQLERTLGKITVHAELSPSSLSQSRRDRMLGLQEVRQRQRLIRDERSLIQERGRVRNRSSGAREKGFMDASAGYAGGFIGAGAKALPFVGGAIGLGSVYHQMNELAGAKMTSEAIFMQYGGTAKQGLDEQKWVRDQSLKLGVNYQDQAEEYAGILANGLGMGMKHEQIRDLFTGLSQYSVATHQTRFQNQRTIKAITDMLGKGQLQAQELKIQLGQAMKGSEIQMAKAWELSQWARKEGLDPLKDRDKIKEKANSGDINKDGKAYTRLLGDMKKGNVMSADILPYFSFYLQEFAKPIMDTRMKASSAILGRIMTTKSMMVEAFGGDIEGQTAGGERGFRTLFNSILELMTGLLPLTEKLGVLFDKLTWQLQPIFTALTNIAKAVDTISNSITSGNTALKVSATILGLMMSKWFRVLFVIEAISLVINDIADGLNGKDSITKRIIDTVDGLGDAEKAAIKFGVAMLGIYSTFKLILGATNTITSRLGKGGKGLKGLGGLGGCGCCCGGGMESAKKGGGGKGSLLVASTPYIAMALTSGSAPTTKAQQEYIDSFEGRGWDKDGNWSWSGKRKIDRSGNKKDWMIENILSGEKSYEAERNYNKDLIAIKNKNEAYNQLFGYGSIMPIPDKDNYIKNFKGDWNSAAYDLYSQDTITRLSQSLPLLFGEKSRDFANLNQLYDNPLQPTEGNQFSFLKELISSIREDQGLPSVVNNTNQPSGEQTVININIPSGAIQVNSVEEATQEITKWFTSVLPSYGYMR